MQQIPAGLPHIVTMPYFYRVITTKINCARYALATCLAVIILALCSAPAANAQIELSNSIDLGYPVLINKYNQNLFYEQLAVGMRFGVSYKPNATQFYPTLDFSFGRTRLPLKQFENNVVYLNANYLNLMLKGNFVMSAFYTNTL